MVFATADKAERAAQREQSVHAAPDPGERSAFQHIQHIQYPAHIEASTEDSGQVRRGKLRTCLSLRGQGHTESRDGHHQKSSDRHHEVLVERSHRFAQVNY